MGKVNNYPGTKETESRVGLLIGFWKKTEFPSDSLPEAILIKEQPAAVWSELRK